MRKTAKQSTLLCLISLECILLRIQARAFALVRLPPMFVFGGIFFRIVAVFQSGGGVGVYALTSFSGTSERLNSPVIYVCIYKFMFAAVGISSSVLLFAWIIAHTMHGKSIPPSPHRIRNAHAINTTENMFKSNM